MKKIFLLGPIFCIFLSCSEQYELDLNLELGKDYIQETNLNGHINQTIDGQEIEFKMEINGKMNYHVAGVNEDDFDLNVSYKDLNMSMKFPSGDINYSSNSPSQEDIFSALLSEMIGKSFDVKISKKGKIISVSHLDEMFNSLFKVFPEIDPYTAQQIKLQLMDSYGEKAFRGNIEMVASIFPNKAVALGDSWEIKTTMESSVKANVISQYTLEKVNDDYYIISGLSKIDSPENSKLENQGVEMDFTLNGKMESKLKVDRKSGWILDGEIEQDINGRAKMPASQEFPEGLEYPISMINKMKVIGE